MTTTLQVLRNDAGQNVHANLYPRALTTDLDFKDTRYPSLSPKPRHNPSSLSADMATMEQRSTNDTQLMRRSYDPTAMRSLPASGQIQESSETREARAYPPTHDGSQSVRPSSQQSQDPSRTSLSYALPENAPRRVVERYSLDENGVPVVANRTGQTGRESSLDTPARSNTPQPARPGANTENPGTLFANTPRHPDVALASSPSANSNGNGFPPIMPLSASPNYQPPVSSRNRTYPQQPTYVNPSKPPNAVDAVYTPMPPPQEEVCLECAMRDQDMADVDVTSPGVWDRTSDVLYEELKEREREEEGEKGLTPDPNSPRAVGGKLTEQNLKIWLSINPREPASRQQTLNTYVKSQRALLEAEALAHAQAMQEAKRLDSKMRDAYSQLRRSAYELGAAPAPVDDSGAVRIKPPISPAGQNHSHNRSQSREVTLLENGMIVETVDVRREEREAKERRRKEEKRARKSSRSSVLDATSVMSGQSGGPQFPDTLRPHAAYSSTTLPRPNSVFTNAGHDRPDIPRAYSQASFSDVHSLGSTSPKRKFFGMRTLSTGWRSQDSLAPSYAPSGMSGSMIDMHVAIQREDRRKTLLSPNDAGASRMSVGWPISDQPPEDLSVAAAAEEKAKKKKSGLIKWWKTVTRSNKPDISQARESIYEKDDGLPLAPPPPLSYLVGRSSPEVHVNSRSVTSPSTPPSIASPMFGQAINVSPPTGSSSALPSPSATRPVPTGFDPSELTMGPNDESTNKSNEWRLHPAASEPDLRGRVMNKESIPPVPTLPNGARKSIALSREKSLPPLPRDESPALPSPGDRPRTVYDPRALPPGTRLPHDFLPPSAPFQNDIRRQSFGGLTSKPNLLIHTSPASGPRQSLSPHYDEFGFSRRSLAFPGEDNQRRATSPLPGVSTKRKSKFGFASLLGVKSKPKEPENYLTFTSEPLQVPFGGSQPFPTMNGSSRYEENQNLSASVPTGSSGGEHQQQRSMRTSLPGRKPLNELVAQDPEFVAYRYPSTEQRLDLLR